MSHLEIFNLLQESLWKLRLTFNMLKHSLSDIFMLKSNHLKHLNYLYYVLRNLMVCVYRERHLLPRNTSHGPGPFISWNFSLRQPVFLFWYDSFSLFFSKFHWYFISPRSAISLITLFTKGVRQKGATGILMGQPDFYQEVARWATWIFQELLRPALGVGTPV